jgi:hypothetical protein
VQGGEECVECGHVFEENEQAWALGNEENRKFVEPFCNRCKNEKFETDL